MTMQQRSEINQSSRALLPYYSAISLSAFLLFEIQLVLGKYFLPWFGGTPAVWTTCMFFFQTLLVAGYLYAHIVAVRLAPRSQAKLHFTILLIALVSVVLSAIVWHCPLTPGSNWKPVGPNRPFSNIVFLLAISAGLPYFLLSTTGPLLQSWFASIYPKFSPYRLYALSNLGSFAALLTYPFLVEPWLKLRMQAWLWSAGFAVYVLCCAYCARRFLRSRGTASMTSVLHNDRGQQNIPSCPPKIGQRLLWFSLAACGALLFLATTNQICQNIAVVPLLWILPLSLYLLSLVICFDKGKWYSRAILHPALALALVLAIFLVNGGALSRIVVQISSYSLILFVGCMVCHGELARSKPAPSYLTSFYLMIAAGGAVGGLFVALIVPHLFSFFWEYQLSLWLSAFFMFVSLMADKNSWLYCSRWGLPLVAVVTVVLPGSITLAMHGQIGIEYGILVMVVFAGVYVVARNSKTGMDESRARAIPFFVTMALSVLGSILFLSTRLQTQNSVFASRNFYGVLTVGELNRDQPEWRAYSLNHGLVPHGFQFRSEGKRSLPTSYYGVDSGIGKAIAMLRQPVSGAAGPNSLRIGVIGLGVGTIAGYAKPGDYVRFYEINPEVVRIARDAQYFTYLRDCPAELDIVVGDARLSLERERSQDSQEKLDLLAIDAFSGDAPPVHVFTEEAFQIYMNRIKPNGIIAAHITNTYLDLRSVLKGIAERLGVNYAFVHSDGDGKITRYSDWVLLSKRPELPGDLLSENQSRQHLFQAERLWTDDYSNLFHALR